MSRPGKLFDTSEPLPVCLRAGQNSGGSLPVLRPPPQFLSGGPKQYKVTLSLYKNYISYVLIRIGIEGPELENVEKAIYTDQ